MPELYGKYELLSKVATGGMAEVWLARSCSIGGFEKILAIKRMHPSLSANEDLVSLFIEEAKLTVSLNHANIVQIFDFGRVDDDYYIAMEYVDGFDLAELAAQGRDNGRPLPIDVSLLILGQVFDGLAYAHRDGSPRIIHRDISPHNVLVSREGQVKISDFGIAKAAEELSATGEVVGKVAYMAPEQSRGEQLTPAADIWSAGVILHELLANQRLFARDNEQTTLEAVVEAEIPRPSALNKNIPAQVDELVLDLLERDPDKRPGDAGDLSERISELLRQFFPKARKERIAEALTGMESHRSAAHRASMTVESTAHADKRRSVSSTFNRPIDVDELDKTIADEGPDGEELRAELERLEVLFAQQPSLWTLADMGQSYAEAGKTRRGQAIQRFVAGKFAQRGLLVQAVALLRQLGTGVDVELERLTELVGRNDDEIIEALCAGEASELDDVLDLLETTQDSASMIGRAPIFSSLSAKALAELATKLRFSELEAGSVVVREGDAGDSFFWIGRGRVLVHAKSFSGRKVYLTALAEGECFGENAFFTQTPRNATVESAEPLLLLEVDRDTLDRLIQQFPAAEETLRQFYKERVAESVLARSPVFGQLTARDRRRLAQRFTFIEKAAGDSIIREDEASDALYAIKSGSVEVFTEGEAHVRIATLGTGEVFGEVAALRKSPRNASIRALEACELLKLEAKDLHKFVEQNQDVKTRLEQQIAIREKDRSEKIGL